MELPSKICIREHKVQVRINQPTTAKIRKQPKHTPMGEPIKKIWYIYTLKYYSAMREKETLPLAMI